MLVAVVSDSHGNREGLGLLAVRLQDLKVTVVLHLGDDYRDIKALKEQGLKVYAVPGVYCPEYARARPANRRVVELAGVKMLLTHTRQKHRHDRPGDPDPEAPPPGVGGAGAKHITGIGRERGRLFILVALDSLLGADAAAEGARA